jgi:hypothetical protein
MAASALALALGPQQQMLKVAPSMKKQQCLMAMML